MATSANLPDLRTEYPPHAPGDGPSERSTLLGLLPGIALLFVVGYAGKFVEHFLNTWTKAHHITFPNIEYVLWAILFGAIYPFVTAPALPAVPQPIRSSSARPYAIRTPPDEGGGFENTR